MARRREVVIQNPKVAKIFLIIFGLIFMLVPLCSVVPIALFGVEDNDVAYEVIDATISEIEVRGDDYKVFVTYTYNGEKYEDIRFRMYSSSMYEGEIIEIQVNPDNPRDIEPTGIFGEVNLILILAVVPFVIAGIVIIIVGIKHDPNKPRGYHYRGGAFGNGNYGGGVPYGGANGYPNGYSTAPAKVIRNNVALKSTGRRMFGVVEKIVVDTDASGKEFKKVYCTCTDDRTGTTYRYSSKEIYNEIDSAVTVSAPIDVYVNPNNMGEYYVDVPGEYDKSQNTYSVPYNSINGNDTSKQNTYNIPYNPVSGNESSNNTTDESYYDSIYNDYYGSGYDNGNNNGNNYGNNYENNYDSSYGNDIGF